VTSVQLEIWARSAQAAIVMRSAFLGLSLLVFGAGALGVACGDDEGPGPGVGGSSSGGRSGSGGAAGSGGRAGSAGAPGSAGAAGSAGAGGSAGAAGAAGAAGSGGASGADGSDAGGGEGDAGAFTLSSTGFDDNPGCGPDDAADACDFFPANSTNFAPGTNTSPELSWTGAPAGTQSFAIALHDLDFVQNGDPFTHWVMWSIPGSTTGLPEGLPDGATPAPPAPAGSQQVSQGDDNGFFGSGACGNVYEFVLYALDTATFTPADDTDPDDVEGALEDSDAVLATTTVRARSGPCD
jgi:Raf kinase inhibitor-like YbhB/YbcL family protein